MSGAIVLLRGAISEPMVLLLACTDAPLDDGVIVWSGYIYDAPGSEGLYSGGEVFADDGVSVVSLSEPFSNYPGYWTGAFKPGAHYTVRVESSPPAVWRVQAPAYDSSWYAGALFGADSAGIANFAGALGLSLPTTGALVIGSPWDAGWTCADVSIGAAAARCFVVDDQGLVTEVAQGQLDFFAADVEAGSIDVASGLGAVETYWLAPGEVGMAFWFVGEA